MVNNSFTDRPKMQEKYRNFYTDPKHLERLEKEVNRFLSTVPVQNRETYKKSMIRVVYDTLVANHDVDNEKDPNMKQIKETKERAAFHIGLEKARAGVDLTSPKED